MASKRILKWEDMQSADVYLAKRQTYTDEQARNLGYPNAEVLRLADELSHIAGQWRGTKDEMLIEKYRDILYAMILKGYDVDMLPIQDQLPSDLMPELPPPAVRMAIIKAYDDLKTT